MDVTTCDWVMGLDRLARVRRSFGRPLAGLTLTGRDCLVTLVVEYCGGVRSSNDDRLVTEWGQRMKE